MKLLNQSVPLENCKSGEILLSAEFIPSCMAGKQKEPTQVAIVENIKVTGQVVEADEQAPTESVKKEKLETIQTAEKQIIKSQETVSESDISTQKYIEKGAKGLRDSLKKGLSSKK